MTSDIAHVLLEEMRALRTGQDALLRGQEALRADIAGVKISAREGELVPGLALHLSGYLQMQIACQSSRIDRFEALFHHLEQQIGRVTSLVPSIDCNAPAHHL